MIGGFSKMPIASENPSFGGNVDKTKELNIVFYKKEK